MGHYDDCREGAEAYDESKRRTRAQPASVSATNSPLPVLVREDELILRAVRWAVRSYEAVRQSGGSGLTVLDLGDEAIVTMVRNNLRITYDGKEGLK